jgi:hypothetical protein
LLIIDCLRQESIASLDKVLIGLGNLSSTNTKRLLSFPSLKQPITIPILLFSSSPQHGVAGAVSIANKPHLCSMCSHVNPIWWKPYNTAEDNIIVQIVSLTLSLSYSGVEPIAGPLLCWLQAFRCWSFMGLVCWERKSKKLNKDWVCPIYSLWVFWQSPHFTFLLLSSTLSSSSTPL